MSASISGTFADDGASALVAVRPNETIALDLSVAGVEEFVGKVIVERSNNAQVWETVESQTGDAMLFDGTGDPLTGTVAAEVLLNETSKRQYYRIRVTEFDGDDLIYALTQVTGDAVEVILRDPQGQPVMSRRDDGGIMFHGPIAGVGEAGDVVFEGGINTPDGIILDEDADGITIVARGEGWTEYVRRQTITAAQIIATTAGGFGHAAGLVLVADPGAGSIVDLITALVVNDRAVAAYTDGGNITVNRNGGAAVTGLVSAANSLGNAADTRTLLRPLAAAGEVLADNKGLNLVTSAAFTNPGTAAGVLRVTTRYRVYETGL